MPSKTLPLNRSAAASLRRENSGLIPLSKPSSRHPSQSCLLCGNASEARFCSPCSPPKLQSIPRPPNRPPPLPPGPPPPPEESKKSPQRRLKREIRRLSLALQAAKALKTSLGGGDIYQVYDSLSEAFEPTLDSTLRPPPQADAWVECPRDGFTCAQVLDGGGQAMLIVTSVGAATSSLLSVGDAILKVSGSESVAASEMELELSRGCGRAVVLEVRRRPPPPPPLSPPLVTIATQTDPVSDQEEEDTELGPLLGQRFPRSREMESLELAAEGFIDDTDLEDQEETLCHVEYEEISLRRASSAERLGLTLCYGTGDDVETDIFVSEVDPDSVAGKDSRIKPGDQILQINSVDVTTRNEAIKLFRADSATVTLLLARTAIEQPPANAARHPVGVLVEEEEEEEAELMGLEEAQEKDSGISRTTDSDPDLPPPLRSPDNLSSHGSSGTGHSPSRLSAPFLLGSPTTEDGLTPTEATFAAQQARGSDASLERELACLHREMETVRLECDRLIAQHASAEQSVLKQMETASELMATVDSLVRAADASPKHKAPASHGPQLLNQALSRTASPGGRHHRAHHQGTSELRRQAHQKRSGQETSSAYNTGGESCRSTPSNMRPEEAGAGLYTGYPPFVQGVMVPELSAVLRDGGSGVGRFGSLRSTSKSSVGVGSGDGGFMPVMYTRPEDVEATIALQQRLLRQAMLAQAAELRSRGEALGAGPVASPSAAAAMEWKVKRRSDGSRYVTRRPVRAKLLKDRAAQLSSERTGLSTDDDAFSELKLGRYWTREEKKRHVESSRERKRRQEDLLRRRAHPAAPDNPILALANKKQMRRKPHQLFDKFTTVQEFLAHGNRATDTSAANMGILSVTTV